MRGQLKEDELDELRYSVEMGAGRERKEECWWEESQAIWLLLRKLEMKQVLDAEEQGELQKLSGSFLFNKTTIRCLTLTWIV